MKETYFEWLLKQRVILILITIMITIFFGYKASKLRLYDDPNKWPPKYDRNVVLNQYLQQHFGGANVVTIQITVKNGDIFNYETLAKVKRITSKIYEIYGVVPYYITSLNTLKVKYMKGTEDALDITPLMEDVPTTPAKMERLKYGVYHNPTVYGPLVSPDSKSTVIIADFRTGEKTLNGVEKLPQTDPIAIYKEINSIIKPENDDNNIVRCTGSPIIIGWVNSEGIKYIVWAFGFFTLIVAMVLFFAFRNFQGVLLPIITALIVSIWAFGAQCLFFGSILRSSAALIVPFIFIAAGSCHSVQFLKRFYEEEYSGDTEAKVAIVKTLNALFFPLNMSLVTDVTAFLVLMVVPFENVSVIGSVAMLGLLSLVICFYTFLAPVLSFSPGPRKNPVVADSRKVRAGRFEQWINRAVEVIILRKKGGWLAVGATGILFIFSLVIIIKDIRPGQDNTYAIHNYLTKSWENNPIYQMEMQIKEKFKGIYPLNILVETKEKKGLKDPATMGKIDDFAEFLKSHQEIGGCLNLSTYVKLMHRCYHEEKDEYFAIPKESRAIGEYLFTYSTGTPGAFDSVLDRDWQRTVIAAYVDSTSPKTVEKIMNAARSYARTKFNSEDISAQVGGGSIAVAEAFNENITKWLIYGTLLSSLASWVIVYLLIGSPVAGIFLLSPLYAATIVWLALMYLSGIEINSNTTSSMSIAMGVGIDSEIYFLYRFREEMLTHGDFVRALIAGFTRIRAALVFSNLALIAGCWALIPIPLYVGYVGYGMGLILLVCFVISFIISPFLWSLFKPKFLVKGLDLNDVNMKEGGEKKTTES